MRREQKVNFELIRATELCYECGYYKQFSKDECVDACTHPESETAYCTAAGCPLGPLAEKSDFIKAGRGRDYEEGEFVVLYRKTQLNTE